MRNPDPTPESNLDAARERSLRDDLESLAAEARVLAEAELAYQKSRAALAGRETPRIAALGLLAAVLAFFALMALVLGAVLALTPALGAWGATGAVTGGLLLAALLCAGIAALRWKRMTRTLGKGGDA